MVTSNLALKLMADVLDTQISNLKMKLSKTKSFEDVKLFHEQFLTQVQSSIFLFNEPVLKCLQDTLNVCLKFSASVSSGAGVAAHQKALSDAFSRHSFLLLKLLSR